MDIATKKLDDSVDKEVSKLDDKMSPVIDKEKSNVPKLVFSKNKLKRMRKSGVIR